MEDLLMKKNFNTLIVLVVSIMLFSIVGCTPKKPLVIKESDTYIVITVSNEQMELNSNTTLVDYMNSLKDDGKLDFEMDNGMVSSVNGIENPSDWSSCWMLYTSDADNANSAWGTVEYKGKIYGSAMFGAESLKVKDGCIYIWIFKSM